jgi:hypothetical protein
MKINLFDIFERDYLGPASLLEPTYDFLNRSARPSVERIRQLLQTWFKKYPDNEKQEFASRFRKDRDGGIDSPFFELYLHEYLLLNGFIPEVHPELEFTSKKTDFLVLQDGMKKAYIEAVIITGESEQEQKDKKRRDQLVDIINRAGVNDFFFSISFLKTEKQQLSANKVITFLENQCSDINPDELAETVSEGGIDKLPNWIFEDNGWVIEFSPMPIKPESRGKKNIRPIGLSTSDFKFIDSKKSILNSLCKKSNRYGSFNDPYVIAANITDPFADLLDVIQSLYGDVKISDSNEITLLGTNNGFWGDWNRPNNQGVSAILLTLRLNPWSICKTNLNLFINPWARYPIQDIFNKISRYELVPSLQLIKIVENIYRLFGLPEDWPKQD